MTRTSAWLCTPLLAGLMLGAPLLSTGCTTSLGGTSDGSGEDNHVLGARASEGCTAAIKNWPDLVAAADLQAASAIYEGGALQDYIRAGDQINERNDDAAIVAALAGDQLSAIRPMIEVAFIARVRTELKRPESLVEDPYAAWDEAYCLWSGALRDLALNAEAVGSPSFDRGIISTIDIAFIDGLAGIDGEPPTASIDDWQVPPARQLIVKTLFRALHRLVLDGAKAGQSEPAAARRALEYFQGLVDRLDGRNTPGIDIIEAMLTEPTTLDPDELHRQLNIAFVKRTRRYCSDALDSGTLGVPSGYKGAVEGRTYQALITPDMALTLGADFDVDAYLATWDAWIDAVEKGDDVVAATELSETLVEWNCAYQSALGIAECTASEDEPQP